MCCNPDFTKFLHSSYDTSHSFSQNCWDGLKYLVEVHRMFPRRVAVLVSLVHKPFLKKKEKFSLLSMACSLLNTIVNFHSTWPFC